MYQLKRVSTEGEKRSFIDLPWMIYEGDPHWVPPLKMAVKDSLDVNKNPFFRHAETELCLAYQKDQAVGRIALTVDENHNRFHQEKVAFFGFFEAINDEKLFRQLLDWAKARAKAHGMTELRGPINLSTNHECGLLIEGFHDSPMVMMTYNPPYYVPLFENYGLKKAKDLNAFSIDATRAQFSDRLVRHANRIRKKGSVQFRSIDLKRFDEEIDLILGIYNDAWEKNWGFVPMEPEEFRHMAKDMKLILDPKLCLIATVNGEPAAFSLALPDVNQVFRTIRNGKLFPTGLLKLLWNLKGPGRRKTINRCRVLTLGIKKKYQEWGIGPLLYTEYLKLTPAAGYPFGEASWILEDNRPMNRALEMMCGERSKVYRIYSLNLSESAL